LGRLVEEAEGVAEVEVGEELSKPNGFGGDEVVGTEVFEKLNNGSSKLCA